MSSELQEIEGRIVHAQRASLAKAGYSNLRKMRLGNGSGTIRVPEALAEAPGVCYVYTQSETGKRIVGSALNPQNLSVPGAEVFVGRRAGEKWDQIIAYTSDTSTFLSQAGQATVGQGLHGMLHYLFGNGLIADPTFITNRQILEFGIAQSEEPDLYVHVLGTDAGGALWIDSTGTMNVFATQDIDMTSYVPSNSGKAVWALVSMDSATGTVSVTAGSEFTAGSTPKDDWTTANLASFAIVAGQNVLGCVYLYQGQTEIEWQHIRRFLGSVTGITGEPFGNPNDVGGLTLASTRNVTLCGPIETTGIFTCDGQACIA